MKDEHHEIQTPKKEQNLSVSSNRKSKSMNTPSKKLNHQQQKSVKTNVSSPITEADVVLNLSDKDSSEKISSVSVATDADQSIVDISKSNLNSDNTVASDDTLELKLPEESVGISAMSEAFVFYDDQSSLESYISSLDQHVSPSSIAYSSLESTPLSSKSPAVITPLSSITTVETTPSSSTTAAVHGSIIAETKSVKPEILAKHLKESMFQVLHSSDIDTNHKKLLDALVKMVIEQFCTSHEDRGSVVGLFSKKVKLVLLSYLLVMLLGSAGFFLLSDVQSCYHGPPPT
ncbi:hypothetical protein HanHA300_Chr13g0474821 [Helianthus annuus]|uniref:uncharacterized protein LOC110897792 n=1 Tax=Helianthus annuus TaxID=4232 RepID=UPI000B9056C3|nr:uncharacterized protein LOC110897792 [Helianthus annuus]KAJ0476219.1 hypothetical protein HanHA300_Chr13g0474821 [Helianthus annuus]KAJ0497026.1 hypothetical protein HanHA89_Chr13g0506741 [Helianthus annuus]KAJ0670551.1 hypothetical protein HanOQP8_Chr13g0475671 [Helianthus annuus]